MPIDAAYQPDPRFAGLGEDFSDEVAPADFPATVLRFRNDAAAASVGLGDLDEAEWMAHFARFQPLPAQPGPLAMRYHGHQFRTYNPELGDGRGFLFAQLREAGAGRLLDLATKGSGQTPWSRFGDGRLTLKGGVREVLAAEMLQALGVPTSRAFSLVETGEALQRTDEPSPTRSAVLTRLSWSHIRFGSLQRHAFHDRADLVQRLLDHVAETYYPALPGDRGTSRATALLIAVVARTAGLCARWMAAGFVHGVLNTDNMNITGESFDYGPWRFLPHSDPGFTAAYFDESGLYAFGRQPQAVFWNLTQLAGCLTLVEEQDPLIEALNGFGDRYQTALRAAVLARLGLRSRDEAADAELVAAAFRLLEAGGQGLRWEPFFFDWFCGDAARATAGSRRAIYEAPEGRAFADVAAGFEPDRPDRLDHPRFGEPEPEEMLYDEVEALWAPIAERDDWSLFDAKIVRVRDYGAALGLPPPYDDLPQIGAPRP
jgi:uncharacterized protein YdiU (UPF0061 family)